MNFFNKKVLFWDANGLAVEHAVRLAKDFEKVWYYTPWVTGFPQFKAYAHGLGVEGLDKQKHFWNLVEKADLIFFGDTGAGDAAEFLRKSGHLVFGPGAAEELEEDRFLLRTRQKDLGMPTQKTKRIHGLTALRVHLAGVHDKYVKLGIFRGSRESFHWKNQAKSGNILDEIAHEWGPFADTQDFTVEDTIDGIEPGADGLLNKHGWVYPTLWGFEHHVGYVGTYTQLPPYPLTYTCKKMEEMFSGYDYRGPISYEVKLPEVNKPYLLDVTVRFPFSLSVCYTESIKNYSEVIWNVASNEPVTLIPAAKYVVMSYIETSHPDKEWTSLIFPANLRNRIKLQSFGKAKGTYCAVKGQQNGFLLVGLNDDLKVAIEEARALADECEADELSKDGLYVFDDIMKDVEDFRKMGGKF